MSGGAFNYLLWQPQYNEDDLRAMAGELRRRGMSRAADETLALIPPRADVALLDLWHAVEWHVSGDWSEDDVYRAYTGYEIDREHKDDGYE